MKKKLFKKENKTKQNKAKQNGVQKIKLKMYIGPLLPI